MTLLVDQSIPRYGNDVVACVLRHHGKICLLRRSSLVGGERGAWHIITGFLPEGVRPSEQALTELEEETSIPRDQVTFVSHSLITFPGPWTVHAFLLESKTNEVHLNWEHTDFYWVHELQIHQSACVPWAQQVWQTLRLAQ